MEHARAGDGDGDSDGDEDDDDDDQEDELMDDFVYWDSIGGHVEDQARPPNRQNGVRLHMRLLSFEES